MAELQIQCERYEETDTALAYLADSLSQEETQRYEEHYFHCSSCFAALEAARLMQSGLARNASPLKVVPYRRKTNWLAIAAALVAAVGIPALWFASKPAPKPVRNAFDKATKNPSPGSSTPQSPQLALLAQFRPPRYEERVLRGAAAARAQAFRRAMRSYSAANYATASANLQQFLSTYPDYAPARFYAASSELLIRNPDAAIADFTTLLASGDRAFTEEAHWGVANAALLNNNAPLARLHLKLIAPNHGTFAAPAAALLTKIDSALPGPGA